MRKVNFINYTSCFAVICLIFVIKSITIPVFKTKDNVNKVRYKFIKS